MTQNITLIHVEYYILLLTILSELSTFTFTFMHLADAFIQSDLHCIQVTVSTFYQLLSKGKDVDENSFPASSLSEMWKQMSVC